MIYRFVTLVPVPTVGTSFRENPARRQSMQPDSETVMPRVSHHVAIADDLPAPVARCLFWRCRAFRVLLAPVPPAAKSANNTVNQICCAHCLPPSVHRLLNKSSSAPFRYDLATFIRTFAAPGWCISQVTSASSNMVIALRMLFPAVAGEPSHEADLLPAAWSHRHGDLPHSVQ